jgi:hypothetical protein
MSALYKSIDEQLSELRAVHEAEMQACKDRTLAAEVESALLKEQLEKCNEGRALAERVTTKLLTQFALVARTFEDARAMALELEQPAEGGTSLPPNVMESTND